MHNEILNKEQIELLPLLSEFKKEFFLVGGTAIALHIGHRRSIDFDLFKEKKLRINQIIATINNLKLNHIITRRVEDQLNIIISSVKFTFFQYPYKIEANIQFNNCIKLPDLLTLSAMKAFALGRRAKWKDYVDLYFILKYHFSIEQITEKATYVFGELFSEKQFRAQLSYFNDVDYTEQVDYIVPAVNEDDIKTYLTSLSIDF